MPVDLLTFPGIWRVVRLLRPTLTLPVTFTIVDLRWCRCCWLIYVDLDHPDLLRLIGTFPVVVTLARLDARWITLVAVVGPPRYTGGCPLIFPRGLRFVWLAPFGCQPRFVVICYTPDGDYDYVVPLVFPPVVRVYPIPVAARLLQLGYAIPLHYTGAGRLLRANVL